VSVIGILFIGIYPQPLIALAQKLIEPIVSLGALAAK
jgi:hypothetical protein